MLEITIPAIEGWDYEKEEFVPVSPPFTLRLEHSLLSISKWESKWKKPFLDESIKKTAEESLDYVRCMTLTQSVPPDIYNRITNDIMDQISEYIAEKQTATWFSDAQKKSSKLSGKKVTSELIYYWMSKLNLPFDKCEKWHISRLLTLIEVCNVEDTPPKKMSVKAIHQQNHSLNAARRKKYNSKG